MRLFSQRRLDPEICKHSGDRGMLKYSNRNLLVSLTFAALLFCVFSVRGTAQAIAGGTSGTVKDSSGAVVPRGHRWFQSSGEDYPASVENDTPFPNSELIVNAQWTTPRYYPSVDLEHADIIPVTWASDGFSYTAGDDGTVGPVKGTTVHARIVGTPPADNTVPSMDFQLLSHDPFSYGCPNSETPNSCYTIGFTNVDGVFFATTYDGGYTYPSVPGHKNGYARVDYSVGKIDQNSWVHGSVNFPKPVDSGIVSFVEIGRGEASHDGCPESEFPHGCIYAIALQDGYRTNNPLDLDQFNANQVYLARMAAGTQEKHYQEVADPLRWQWFSGFDAQGLPTWIQGNSPRLGQAIRSISYPRNGKPGCAAGSDADCRFWNNSRGTVGHMNYPHMAYDAGLHRYFLTFADFYYRDYTPQTEHGPMVQGGAEGIVLEAPHPWGPWSFVMRSPYLGSGNGYSPSFPVQWMDQATSAGQDLWMVWAANWARCGNPLLVPADQCQGEYAMNLRRLQLTLATTPDAIRRPWYDQDVGFASPGKASVEAGTVTIGGNGSLPLSDDPLYEQYHDGLDHDAFHYVFQQVKGNGAIQAEIRVPDPAAVSGSGPEASAGLMIREASYAIGTTDDGLKGKVLSSGDVFSEDARYAYVGVRRDGALFLQYRDYSDQTLRTGRVKLVPDACAKGCTLRISRDGNMIHASYFAGEGKFEELGSYSFSKNFRDTATMGMAATSDSPSTFPQYDQYHAAFSGVEEMEGSGTPAASNAGH
jgi:hypothetical protein